jgi:hypothetical protein
MTNPDRSTTQVEISANVVQARHRRPDDAYQPSSQNRRRNEAEDGSRRR